MPAGLIFFYVNDICIPWPHRCVENSKRNLTLQTRLRGAKVNLYAYKRILINRHVFNYKVYTDT